jgi:hypothetical protein
MHLDASSATLTSCVLPAEIPEPIWVPLLAGATLGGLFAALNRYRHVRVHVPPSKWVKHALHVRGTWILLTTLEPLTTASYS